MKPRHALAVLCLLVLWLAAPAGAHPGGESAERELPALTPGPDDALGRALATGALSDAEYALARAEAIFRPTAARARFGDVQASPPRAATPILRDLALRLRDLRGDERARAAGILARPFSEESTLYPRPDDSVFGFPPDPGEDQYLPIVIPSGTYRSSCYQAIPVCVTFVTATGDSIPLLDGDGDQTPDYLESVLASIQTVWDREIGAMGFRQPKSDATSANHGIDGRLDVYLVDLPAGVFGYCATDDPKLSPQMSTYDVSAYCVFDNDYLEYGPEYTPEQNLQVTVAHEFFHAVQYAYDALEDLWFMEASSTWMEDEVFDDVDQNRYYLSDSPLAQPGEPLDYENPRSLWVYGTWIFLRYLTEQDGPELVRAFWNRAGGAAGDPDDYSLQAIDTVLPGGLGPAFADFSAANLTPERAYEEGAAYPAAPAAASMTISKARRSASRVRTVDHMASASIVVRPGAGVAAKAKVRLVLDFPDRLHEPQARVVSILKSGAVRTRTVSLNRLGNAALTLPFGNVRRLVVVAVNAGARYDCWEGLPLACQGIPLDDDLPFRVRATLARG